MVERKLGEAAAQGLFAGLNAARRVLGEGAFQLDRSSLYRCDDRRSRALATWLKRPEMDFERLQALHSTAREMQLEPDEIAGLEVDLKYEGYLDRHRMEVERLKERESHVTACAFAACASRRSASPSVPAWVKSPTEKMTKSLRRSSFG
jgi:tRNA U34 5-carboxymethylaminomethyl modifying enzyme MnmG/GidA